MSAKADIDLLSNVRIASPCAARWEDMQGDERARFCRHCQKHVYNFSLMTSADAAALIREREGNLCARFYQRGDGTMLTADCSVGVARHWRRVKAFVGAAVATLVMTLASVGMARQADAESRKLEHSRLAQLREQTLERVKLWLGLSKPAPMTLMLGDVCLPLPPTNQLTGRNSAPPPIQPPAK